MKTQLLALSLLSSAGLIAEHESTYEQNQYAQDTCNPCCACPCECKPCCVPKRKKCIDCEYYPPAYYDLQCDWGAFVTVDFLYWYAGEDNLSYRATAQRLGFEGLAAENSNLQPRTSFTSYLDIDTEWDPGFRIGLGWNSDCDGWDAFLNWTYMKNTSKDSTSTDLVSVDISGLPVEGAPYLINPWVNFEASSDFRGLPYYFNKISAKWQLYFNQIDLEIGRKYWLSPCFTLLPYAGVLESVVKRAFGPGNHDFSQEGFLEAEANSTRVCGGRKNLSWGKGDFHWIGMSFDDTL